MIEKSLHTFRKASDNYFSELDTHNESHLWLFALPDIGDSTPGHQQYAYGYAGNIKRGTARQFLAHLLCREVLSSYRDCRDRELKFSVNEYGKPGLLNVTRYFNLSHSGDVAAILVSDVADCGVDIECHGRQCNFHDIAEIFFCRREIESIKRNGKINFFDIWTRKEAIAKASGMGVNKAIMLTDCLAAKDSISIQDTRFSYLTVPVFDGYSISLSFASDEFVPLRKIFVDLKPNDCRIQSCLWDY